jgi:ElaB/YqjD/DUF883 family membrane-anchored ribosome-binding protein
MINRLFAEEEADRRTVGDGSFDSRKFDSRKEERFAPDASAMKDLADKAALFVKRHPAACVAAAGICGVLLGIWIKRS